MPRILVETLIHSDLDACFDAARDMGLHRLTAQETGEVIVSGPQEGLLDPGIEVVFEARHLGVRQQLGAKITQFERPHRFVDEMTRGVFVRLQHAHEFEQQGDHILMRDTLEWTSPLGPLGALADWIIVKRHLRNFLRLRGERLRRFLEVGGQPRNPPAPLPTGEHRIARLGDPRFRAPPDKENSTAAPASTGALPRRTRLSPKTYSIRPQQRLYFCPLPQWQARVGG